MAPRESLTIEEVVENLSNLAEANSLEEIELGENNAIISHKEGKGTFVPAGPNEETLAAIRENFRVAYKYLQSYYKKMQSGGDEKKFHEGINTIMVLVGEAAQKLEKFDRLFKERIPVLEEYKNLQHFYQTKMGVKVIEEEMPWGKEIEGLLEFEEISGIHVLNDIEVVKGDRLYELFYLKNEAGHNFYTQDLARHIKLACDFATVESEEDPLLKIKSWEDRALQETAASILNSSRKQIETFYKQAMKYRDVEVVATLHDAVLALMLAANPQNLIEKAASKGCHRYFFDFQFFMRKVLENREIQKYIIYSSQPQAPFMQDVVQLAHALIFDLFTKGYNQKAIQEVIASLVSKPKDNEVLSTYLKHTDERLRDILRNHPSGPAFKALDLIREEQEGKAFDPIWQGNLPGSLYDLNFGNEKVTVLRIPTPTHQEYVDEAAITEEFKAFLDASVLKEKGAHLLAINFQDRTSWREHARSRVLEELCSFGEYADKLTVVTLSKETDFYHQIGIYAEQNEAKSFINQLQDHLTNESAGNHFPQNVKNNLFPILPTLLAKIHATFFGGKATLSNEERLSFIELAYNFIILKLVEITKPRFLGFVSKDALDAVSAAALGFFLLIEEGHHKKISKEEKEKIVALLFGPTLMHRERAIHRDCYERLISLLIYLEGTAHYLKGFSSLFGKEILQVRCDLR